MVLGKCQAVVYNLYVRSAPVCALVLCALQMRKADDDNDLLQVEELELTSCKLNMHIVFKTHKVPLHRRVSQLLPSHIVWRRIDKYPPPLDIVDHPSPESPPADLTSRMFGSK